MRCLRVPLSQAMAEVRASTTSGCSLRYPWLQAMDELWAPEGVVTCTHPGHAPLNGREDIMASWQSILGAGAGDEHTNPDPD